MKIRADIAELLHAGHSDRAIAEQLHTCAKSVAAARTVLGLPKAKSGYAAAESLSAAFHARTKPAGDGHLLWTGHVNNTGSPCFRWQRRLWTAYRAAFEIRYGRLPVGKALPGCDMPHCVAPDHVQDRPMRDALDTQFNAIFGGAR